MAECLRAFRSPAACSLSSCMCLARLGPGGVGENGILRLHAAHAHHPPACRSRPRCCSVRASCSIAAGPGHTSSRPGLPAVAWMPPWLSGGCAGCLGLPACFLSGPGPAALRMPACCKINGCVHVCVMCSRKHMVHVCMLCMISYHVASADAELITKGNSRSTVST